MNYFQKVLIVLVIILGFNLDVMNFTELQGIKNPAKYIT